MGYNAINFNDFIKSINEGLIKTYDIDFTILTAKKELSLLNVPHSIEKTDRNTILLTLFYFHKINIDDTLDFLNQIFSNQLGWFPSYTYITNTLGLEASMIYDEGYLKANYKHLGQVKIIYESKIDFDSLYK